MSRNSTTLIAHHDSKPLRYTTPYLFTYDAFESTASVMKWTAESEPTLYVKLEGKLTEPWNQFILSPDLILSQTDISIDSSLLTVHKLPSGMLLDHLFLGPTSWFSTPGGKCALLGVVGDNFAIWTNDGPGRGNGYVNVYTVSQEGKFILVNTLQPPNNLPNLETSKQPGRYSPPQLIYLTREVFIGSSYHYDFPISSYISRWTCDSNATACVTFDFVKPQLPFEHAQMYSTLEDHVTIPSTNTVIAAHYEHPLETNDNINPITSVRLIDTDTLQAKWTTPINRHIDFLRYSASLDVILAFSSADITILDRSTGALKGSHPVGKPEHPCGTVTTSKMGCHIDLTPSGEEIVMVFGDGQLAASGLGDFILYGFPSPNDGDPNTVATRPCPGSLVVSAPKNSKERKQKVKGVWKWVRRAIIGEGQLLLEVQKSSGFVVLSWK